MRELSAQLLAAERVALEAEQAARVTSSYGTGMDSTSLRETSILTDTHGRHHNYLRISLTER